MKIKTYLGLGLILLSGAVLINMFIDNRAAWFVLDILIVLVSVPSGYYMIKDR